MLDFPTESRITPGSKRSKFQVAGRTTTAKQLGIARSSVYRLLEQAAATAVAAKSGSITLGQVAAHTAVLAVAYSRCDRAGRYSLDTLIARHGPGFGVPVLLALLSADCPKRAAVSAYDLCGIHCPDLTTFFRV